MITGLLGFEEVQQRQGGIDRYISPSRLGSWLRCPLAFKYAYIDGIRQPTTPSLFLGRIVHSALEAFYRNRQLGITLTAEDITKRMIQNWGMAVDDDNMQFDSVAEEQTLQKQAINLVTAYIEQVPADEPNRWR